jgi:hypothetical protein
MYDDYAISEISISQCLWTERSSGLSYINHIDINKKILLLLEKHDENGNTMGYVFIGEEF